MAPPKIKPRPATHGASVKGPEDAVLTTDALKAGRDSFEGNFDNLIKRGFLDNSNFDTQMGRQNVKAFLHSLILENFLGVSNLGLENLFYTHESAKVVADQPRALKDLSKQLDTLPNRYLTGFIDMRTPTALLGMEAENFRNKGQALLTQFVADMLAPVQQTMTYGGPLTQAGC